MARTKVSAREMFRPLAPGRRSRAVIEPGINPALEAIWNVVAAIPRGQVSTYGDVARAAGLPRHHRQAAYALRVVPPDMNLPWQRVLGAGGKIVFPKGSSYFREQVRRLKGDGVKVKDGRVAREIIMDIDKF